MYWVEKYHICWCRRCHTQATKLKNVCNFEHAHMKFETENRKASKSAKKWISWKKIGDDDKYDKENTQNQKKQRTPHTHARARAEIQTQSQTPQNKMKKKLHLIKYLALNPIQRANWLKGKKRHKKKPRDNLAHCSICRPAHICTLLHAFIYYF